MPAAEYYRRNRAKCIMDTAIWKEQNRERARENNRLSAQRVRATPEGKKRSNAAAKRYRQSHKEVVNKRTREWFGAHPEYEKEYRLANLIKWIFKSAKYRAQKLRVPFTISLDDIYLPHVCPVLGIELDWTADRRKPYSLCLDRVVPSLGYVPGNTFVISRRANTIKWNSTLDELKCVVAYIEKGGP